MHADEDILGYEYVNNAEYKGGEHFYLKVKDLKMNKGNDETFKF